eukprot:gb/GEZN01000527.1/.p1 GENE.gb/GEZN01000527.1/~~gb/GEZN01000527.1/.p1  ORF type:complete len:1292 (-),score=288.54 gb/GEZN01000527.1/:359-4150(-)
MSEDLGEEEVDKYAGYNTSLPTEEEEEMMDVGTGAKKKLSAYQQQQKELKMVGGGEQDVFAHRKEFIADRESEYQSRRRDRIISPERPDPFADVTPAHGTRTYKDVMEEARLEREQAQIIRNIEKKKQAEAEKNQSKSAVAAKAASVLGEPARKKRRWDAEETPMTTPIATPATVKSPGPKSPGGWDQEADDGEDGVTPSRGGNAWDATPSRWDATPARDKADAESTPAASRWDATPTATPSAAAKAAAAAAGKSRWDATPVTSDVTPAQWDTTPQNKDGVTPTPKGAGKRSRWDETPREGGATPGSSSIRGVGPTPKGNLGMQTPMTAVQMTPQTPEQMTAARLRMELDARNRPLTDEELDLMLPVEGYEILVPPEGYKPLRGAQRGSLLSNTPTPMTQVGYEMPATPVALDIPQTAEGMALSNPDDMQYFKALLDDVDESTLTKEELKERQIMGFLLKVKNGTPPQRKSALRQLTAKARWFGAGPLFNQILPLLMSPTLEDQERHLLVKVIDRILFKLDDLVRPYVHKILVVIEPLLIDEDYYARVEGREIISNLAKAAGLATMIATMRPDIDNVDEYVRNTTARAFAVVASALGIHSLLPFLKAVCQSKRSWQARHTGIKICQQIAILMGCAILPHLKNLVEIIEHGLEDEQSKVRCICALALAALAEAASPYGIESFDSVLRPLWKGIRQHRGKTLAAFLKAIGYIIPLMDASHANYYTREVMVILLREFTSPDEEMKKIVLKVVKQCVSTDGVEPDYVKAEILPQFFRNFWVRRMAIDRRNYAQLVETSVELANKVGGAEIVRRIVEDLKDESEPYRKMVMETIEEVLRKLGASDVEPRLEELLIDGILYAFQEQTSDDTKTMLNGFGVVVNALGTRVKVYFPQICGIIKWRLNNKTARVRQQAADLIARIASVMKDCGEEQLLCHLGVVLYEYLGEEYPEVLGSILGAIKAVVNVVGMERMTPPIKDLLPRLTPILKNRHEKVQENCIDLVGRIADRGAEYVPAKEWMRICFELLEMLKAHKKAIRRATVNTFGYIAKAIGPQDVLATLLNNLKVQERQNRVCTTVAIAIVAETCSPFTVLPALMNEYRVPELNVQNGVLKAMSFLFEYIGEMGKDYVYAVVPLLEDALMDRDLVHRQIACNVVKHMSLGAAGLSREDAMVHLLNYVWPNLFETSPHVITSVLEAIEGLRVALGPTRVLQYALQGLFHPARKVRSVYWRIYNTLYISCQDALVPAYPRFPNEKGGPTYHRAEMDVFL